jgi:peptidoglycan/LPS O-acetylase OafA/YrhL
MHPKYRPDIDGLRAVAVASVVAYHAFPKALPGGFVGVDIFFVISGFLITTIILQSQAAGDFSYRDFYARRVRRIFPALMLVLAATLAFGWYVLLNREFVELGKQAAGGAAFIANFVFWGEAGYFDTAAETKPLLHLWSLGIEEQFYIFWPPLLALAWRRRWPMLRVLWALAVVSFLINVLTIHPFRTAAFYSPLSRFWELMAGGILACMRLRDAGATKPAWRSHVQSVLGVGLIVLGLVMIRADKAFPGWWALLPVLGAASCIAAGPQGVLNRYLLSNPLMVGIGLISYPLYLWHWPLLSYARIVQGAAPSAAVSAAMVAASVVLAWLTYRTVERAVRTRTQPATLRVLGGSAVAVLAVAVAVQLGLPAPRHDNPMLQTLSNASSDGEYYEGLASETLDGHFVRRIGEGARKVLVIGDSHISQYAPRARALARSAPDAMSTTYFFEYPACAPVPGMVVAINPGCAPRRAQMLKSAFDPKIDAVMVGACWNCYFTGNFYMPYVFQDGASALPINDGGPGIEPALASLQKLLGELARHKTVYLLLDNPMGSDFEPGRMIAGSRLGTMTVLATAGSAVLPPAQERLNDRLRAIALAAGAEPIDAVGQLCREGRCLRTMPDGAPAYLDSNHLRPAYIRDHARYVDPVFLAPAAPSRAGN